ncbi:MAG: C69 family dipeptidase [Clostridia bacterium]|nr:C69 family dipeptidase [Clostridia bacterium]
MRRNPGSCFKGRLITVAVCILVLAVSSAAFACTSVLVSPGASVDGSASVTQTADCGMCAFEIEKIPAKDWPEGATVEAPYLPQFTGGYQIHDVMKPTGKFIPQVAHTNGYIKGIFGMINDKQVGIGETTTSNRPQSKNPNGIVDITNLSMLAMERGNSAREAIQTMGDVAVTYGYKDAGEALAVSDSHEAWLFEISGPGPLWEQGDVEPGAFWIAQRVPDGHIAACCNNAVIDVIDFDDHSNFMYGPGIKEYAIEKGWYDPASGAEFSWRKHFCNATSFVTCGRRVWRIFGLAAPSLAGTLDETNLPFSVPVDKKLSIADIAAIHRDHYEGTPYDSTKGVMSGPWGNPRSKGTPPAIDGNRYAFQRRIAIPGCEYSIIAQSRAWLPDAIGGILWYAPSNPDGSNYVPIYNSVTNISECLNTKAGDHHTFTRTSYWWAVSAVNTYADLKYSYIIKDIQATREQYEGLAIKMQAAIDTAALHLYENDPKLATEFLTDYCNRNVESARDGYWDLLDRLMCKYNAWTITEDGKITTPALSEDWVRMMIQFDTGDWYKR